ncbi:MAG: SxtJ family membrane protein [Gammaproteobacteria bacterium]
MTGTPTYNEADRQELRTFGLVFATGIVLIFGLLLPWLFEHPWPTWPWIAAGILVTTALLLPPLLRPVYWLWMKFGHVLGWINTRIILGITFLLLFIPVALVFHLFGKDPMRRRLDPSASSYRIKSEHLPRERMEKPF